MIQSGPTVAPKPEAQQNRPGFRGHDLEFNNFLLPSQRFEVRNFNGLPLGSARLLGGESEYVNRKVMTKCRVLRVFAGMSHKATCCDAKIPFAYALFTSSYPNCCANFALHSDDSLQVFENRPSPFLPHLGHPKATTLTQIPSRTAT
jgi:hypothetical protein